MSAICASLIDSEPSGSPFSMEAEPCSPSLISSPALMRASPAAATASAAASNAACWPAVRGSSSYQSPISPPWLSASSAAAVASAPAADELSSGSTSVSVSVAAERVLAGSVSKNVSSSAGWVGSDSGMSASSGSPPDASLIGSGNKGSSAPCAPRVRSLAVSSKASPALMRSSLEAESPGAPGCPVSP